MRAHLPPPRLASRLLLGLIPDRNLEYALGDLAEEYALRASCGSRWTASYWYWIQISRSAVPMMAAAMVRTGRVRTLVVAVGAYLAASIAEAIGTAGLRQLALNGLVFDIANTSNGLLTIAAGGYVAARLQPCAVPVLAGIVGAVVVLLMIAAGGNVPVWYQLTFLLFGPAAAVAGSAVACRVPRTNTGSVAK
jgi:hypothetical protein